MYHSKSSQNWSNLSFDTIEETVQSERLVKIEKNTPNQANTRATGAKLKITPNLLNLRQFELRLDGKDRIVGMPNKDR